MPGNTAPVDDEKGQLLAFLDQQRLVIRLAGFGLTDDQARATPSASALSVGGLIKHVVHVERAWMDTVLERPRADDGGQADYQRGFQLGPDESLESVLDDYARAAAETDRILGSLDLDRPVPVPRGVPWFPDDIDAWSVRWVVLHLITETARHAGHADIVRETVDGASAFPLMAAAEGWPATPWMQPWSPASG
jgi:uncharacterized damage-inducible protein DinB